MPQVALAHEVELAEVQPVAAPALLADADPHGRHGQDTGAVAAAVPQHQEMLGGRRQRLLQLLRGETDVLLELRQPQHSAVGTQGLGEEAAHRRVAHGPPFAAVDRDGMGRESGCARQESKAKSLGGPGGRRAVAEGARPRDGWETAPQPGPPGDK